MMRKTFHTGLFLLLLGLLLTSVCEADRMFSIDAGYLDTHSSEFGSGLIYGASIIEGTGRIGFGVTARRFSNSIFYDRSIKVGDGAQTFEYEELFSDFYITVLASYNMRFGENSTHVLAGAGPQVHFIKATKYFITDGYSVAARDFRMGFGLLLRIQQRVYALGGMAVVLTSTYSWAESGGELTLYDYGTPGESIAFPAVTAGLAFPF
jgi:hypothetical protein